MDEYKRDFIQKLIGMGILSYDEHETLWDIAKRCKKMGIASGGAGALYGAAAGGSVSLGALTIPAGIAGFLGGFASGAGSCVALNITMRNQLKALVQELKR